MRPWNQPSPLPSARSLAFDQVVAAEPLEAGARLLERPCAFVIVTGGPEIRAVHTVELVLGFCVAGLRPGGRRRVPRRARRRRPRLPVGPRSVEPAVAQHLAVRHAVEREAAGEAEIVCACLGRDRAREPKHNFLSVTA
jgi:hypothetical protein